MTTQHKSLCDEVLFIIGRSSEPLDSGQIYERCTLADEIKRVSDALWVWRNEGKIGFAPGDGRKRYVLASGVSAPAPAGKTGRAKAVQADDAARVPLTGVRPAPELALPKLDIPTLADPAISLDGAAGTSKRVAPVKKSKADHIAGAGNMIDAERLADAIIERLKKSITPRNPIELQAAEFQPTIHINIHIEQADFRLGGL